MVEEEPLTAVVRPFGDVLITHGSTLGAKTIVLDERTQINTFRVFCPPSCAPPAHRRRHAGSAGVSPALRPKGTLGPEAASPDPVNVSDPLNVRVEVTNYGPDPASGLAATLDLPADAIFLGEGSGWSCELSGGLPAGSDLACDGGTLEPGPTSQLDVFLLAPGIGGAYGLAACASAAEEDGIVASNCVDASVVVIDDSMTDLAIVKSVDGVDPTPGTRITYSILVSNRGPNPAYGALVEDVFPPELIDVAWTCEGTVGSSCTATGVGNILDTVDIASDGALLYAASATVGPAATGPIANVATVEAPASMADIVPGNNLSTLLPSGKVLVAGGNLLTSGTSSAELYDPSTGTWESTGNLVTPRSQHTSTLLPSGRILVAGGYDGSILSSAELYDPSTGTWEKAGDIATIRYRHTSTLLSSGKVIVTGGYYNGNVFASTELYDPNTGTWQSTGSLATSGSWQTSTLLHSGEVLVAGGYNGSYLSSAETYDPRAGTWVSTENLATPRHKHTSTLLLSGKVLVAGGYNGSLFHLSSAEIYDPSTRTWETTGSLGTPRYQHTSTLLPSGKVLVAGGIGAGYLSSAELYDPSTGAWESTADLATPRNQQTSTLLPSGKVLIAGGFNGSSLSSAELYDPSTGTWERTGDLTTPRYHHTSTLLPSGQVLVTGGYSGNSLSSAELYDPSTGSWESVANLATPRFGHKSILLPSGKVLIAGGYNRSSLSSAEFFDPSTGSWESAGNLATPRYEHTVTLLLTGKVLVSGGWNSSYLSTSELYGVSALPNSRFPIIRSTSQLLRFGSSFAVTGSQFRGDSEASSGNSQNSAVNYPFLQLRSFDGTAHHWLTPDPQLSFWDDPMTLTVSELPPSLNPGLYFLTVIVAGVPSEPAPVEFECSLAITAAPTDQTGMVGETATFTVETQGGRWFQWQRDGIDIPGATGPSYTTPSLTVASPGTTTFRVLVDSGCTSQYSEAATLTLADGIAPTVQVTSPVGGERWPLSSPGEPHTELLTWAMIDNIRICQVDVALLHSDDAG